MFAGVRHVSVLVSDTDEAIECDTEQFGMELRADEEFGPGAGRVTGPPTARQTSSSNSPTRRCTAGSEPKRCTNGSGRAR
jgi:hypothetical protein